MLQPGAIHSFDWNGRLRRRRLDSDGEDCFDAFPHPPGRYVLRACAVDVCGRVEVELPAESVRIRLGVDVSQETCPLEGDVSTERSVIPPRYATQPRRW